MNKLDLIRIYESDLIYLETKKSELLEELKKVNVSEYNTQRWIMELKEESIWR